MIQDDFNLQTDHKMALVSVICDKMESHRNESDTLRSLNELKELLRTLGVEYGNVYYQRKEQLDAATVLGSGKLEEIAKQAKEEGCKTLVFDFELTGSQVRNIKKLTGLDAIDRISVILEIFARHAKTRDAKIQIEILRLEYMLPRLTTLWTHFSRQRGGVGVRGGEGEQQLELDKRMIRERISIYKKELKEITTSRSEQKKKRKQTSVVAALVGYTNAGKSTLMNKLCKVNVLAEDKLFATLDSTYRMLNPDTKPPMILADTVGFISNLPSTLINGFKTTLESAMDADLLLIVCDISDPHFENHLTVTDSVLTELDAISKPKIIIFNKVDKINKADAQVKTRKYNNAFLISANNEDDINNLREEIINFFLDLQQEYELFVPYDRGDIQSKVISKANILNTTHHETGTFYKIRLPDNMFQSLNLAEFITAPKDQGSKKFKLGKNK